MATPLKWPRAGMRDQTMKSLSSLIQLSSRNLKSLKPVNQSLVANRFIAPAGCIRQGFLFES